MSNDYKTEKQFLDALAKRIAAIRKSKDLTQEDVAGTLNTDRVVIANIETGKRRPTVTTIYRISSALGVSVGEVFKNL